MRKLPPYRHHPLVIHKHGCCCLLVPSLFPYLRELDEERRDVRKVGHMGNFYANLLTKNVAFGGKDKEKEQEKEEVREGSQEPEQGREQSGEQGRAGEAEEGSRQRSASPQAQGTCGLRGGAGQDKGGGYRWRGRERVRVKVGCGLRGGAGRGGQGGGCRLRVGYGLRGGVVAHKQGLRGGAGSGIRSRMGLGEE